jgi:hypothetical protein
VPSQVSETPRRHDPAAGAPDGVVRGSAEPAAPVRALATIVACGVLLRLVLVCASGRSELQSDEANYVYLGLAQQQFGVLLDQYRYLWPPFHPWLLGEALVRFGLAGAVVVQVLQALSSAAIGASVGLMAWRLGSARAALVATGLWAVHLPLAGYTHMLWSETFFLALFTPALERLVAGLQADTVQRAQRCFLAAGLLLGASLWVKSFATYVIPVLAVVVFVLSFRRFGAVRGLRVASLVALAPFVVTLPWALRNVEVYGRFVPSGATLGENAYIGLNTRYMNFDYVALDRSRTLRGLTPIEDLALVALVAPPQRDGRPVPGWKRAEELPHTVDRQSVQLDRALTFAREHPGWALRTRIKHVADLVTPLSFTTRHAALGLYGDGWLGRAPFRHVLVIVSLGTSVLVLLGAAVGLARGLRSAAGFAVFVPVLGYVGASALLLSMSRVRLPAEPLLIVLAALAFVHALEPLDSAGPSGAANRAARVSWTVAAILVSGLVALFGVNGREVVAVTVDALRGGRA